MKNFSQKIALALALVLVFGAPTVKAQTATSAVLNASINTGGRQMTAWFEYGTNPNLNTWMETERQVLGAQTGSRSFSQTVYNLTPNTNYYFRVATNDGYNTNRAQILSFTTGSVNNQVNSVNTDTVNVTRYVINETKYVDRVLAPQTVNTQPVYYQQVAYQPVAQNVVYQPASQMVAYQYQPVVYQPSYQQVAYQPVAQNVVYQPASQMVAYQQPTYQPAISATTYQPANTTYNNPTLVASPVFGANFLPNSVFGWLVLIALILAVILVARRLARA